jgi:hypothetical protein
MAVDLILRSYLRWHRSHFNKLQANSNAGRVAYPATGKELPVHDAMTP